MTTKAERNAAAYEQVVTILTAVGTPMTMPEIAEHAMFRPLNATTRSLGQWLKFLMKKGTIVRRGTGSRAAKYSLGTSKRGVAQIGASQTVLVRVRHDGTFHSVQAPAGAQISLEFVA